MDTQRFNVLCNSGKMDFFDNTSNYLQDIHEKIIKTDEVLKLLDGKKKELYKLDKKYKKLLEKFLIKNNELSNINTSWEQKVEVLKTENAELIKKHFDHVNEAEKKYQSSYLEVSELTKTCDILRKKLEKSEQKEKNNHNTKKLQDTLNQTKEQLKESIRKYEELQTSTNQIISELKNESKNHVDKKNETLKQLAKARLDCDELKKSLNLRNNSPTKNKLKEEIKELESKLENTEVEIDLLNQSYKNDIEELKKKHGQEIAKLKSKLVIENTEETTRKHEEEKKILEDHIEELKRKIDKNNEKYNYEKNVLEKQIIELKKISEKERNTSSTQTDFEDIFTLDDILTDTRILPMLTPMSLDEDEISRASETCENIEPQKEIEEQPQQEIEDQHESLKEIEDTCAQNLIKVRSSSELYSEIPVEAEIRLVENSTQTEDQESVEFKFEPSIILPKNNVLKNIPRNIKLKSRVTKKYKNNKNKMLSALKSSNLNIKNLMQNYLDTNNKIVIMSPSILNQNFDRANYPFICQSQFQPFGQNLPCCNSFYNSHCSNSRQFNHRNLVNSSESEDDIRDFLKDYKYRVINKYLSKNNWRRQKTVINKFKHRNNKFGKKRKNTKKRLRLSSDSSDSESNNEKFNNKKNIKQTKSSKYKRIITNSKSKSVFHSDTESSDSENKNADLNKKVQNKNSFKFSEKRNCFNSCKSKTNSNNKISKTVVSKLDSESDSSQNENYTKSNSSKNSEKNNLKTSRKIANKKNVTVLSNLESSSDNENNANTEILKTKKKQTKFKKVKSKEIISESEVFTSDFENICSEEQIKNGENEKTTKMFNKTVAAKFITPPSSITDDEEPKKIDERMEMEDVEEEKIIENDNQDNAEHDRSTSIEEIQKCVETTPKTNEDIKVRRKEDPIKNGENEKTTKLLLNKTVTAKFIPSPSSITDGKEKEPKIIDEKMEMEDVEEGEIIENDNQDNEGEIVIRSIINEVIQKCAEASKRNKDIEVRRKEDTITKDVEKIQDTRNVKNIKQKEIILQKQKEIRNKQENEEIVNILMNNAQIVERTKKHNKIKYESQQENNEILLKSDEISNNSFGISSDEDFKGFESPTKTKINKNCEIIKCEEQPPKQNEENKENITKTSLIKNKSINYLSMNKRQQTILRKFAFNKKINSLQIKKDPISLQDNKRKPEKISCTPIKRMKLLLFGEESNSDSDDSNCSLSETENTIVIKNLDEDIKSNERIGFVEEKLNSNNEIISIANEKLVTNLEINEASTTEEKERVFKRPVRSKLSRPIRKQIVNKVPQNISSKGPVEHIEFKKETEDNIQKPRRSKLIPIKKEIVNNVLPNIPVDDDPFDLAYNTLERPTTEINEETESDIEEFSPAMAEKLVLDIATLNWDEQLIITTANYLSDKDPEIVARVILKQAVKDFSQQFDKTFTPPAPLLTPIQQKILVLVSEIEHRSPNFHTVFLEALEKMLLSEKRVEVVHSLTRIYVTQRKLKYEIEQVRMLCCHAAYYMGDLVLPLVYIILTSWGEVLPKSESAEDLPLVIALVHVIQLKSCREPGFNYRNLNQLLKSYYEYRLLEDSNEQIMNKLINFYSASYSNSAYTSILILCRNLPPKWTYTQIKNNLLPLLAKSENKEMTISLINRLMENFNVSIFSEYEYISDIRSNLEKYGIVNI